MRKPVSQKKLLGTYRNDRDGNKAEPILAELMVIPVAIDCPSTITDEYCKSYWKYHTDFLITCGVLSMSDVPELENLYITLQRLREINKKILTLDLIKDLENYTILSSLSLKLSKHFSELAGKYLVSPAARIKLKTDDLNLKKLEAENPSIMEKLIARKKA
jgi:hypothetical protein